MTKRGRPQAGSAALYGKDAQFVRWGVAPTLLELEKQYPSLLRDLSEGRLPFELAAIDLEVFVRRATPRIIDLIGGYNILRLLPEGGKLRTLDTTPYLAATF
jgi:hypothetical protein